MEAPVAWSAPPLSTDVDEAATAYQRGVAALVAGLPGARSLLERAVALDDGFLLAHVALAVADRRPGWPASPASAVERRHAETVAAFFASARRRALDLRREHLAEVPGDLLVVWIPLAQLDG